MMIGSVSVGFLDDKILVSSYSRTVNGPYVLNGWLEVLSGGALDTELGSAVRNGLTQTEDGIPSRSSDDPERVRPLENFLKAANVRTYSAYLRAGARSVSVDVLEGGREIEIIPMRNGGIKGPKKGFTEIGKEALVISLNSTDEELGEALRAALEHCEVVQPK